MAAYVTPAEFLLRKDARDVGDLVSDDETQVAAGDLLTDPVLLAAIDDASGDIDTALMGGGRYTAADLEGLTGNSLATLRRIASELTMFHLLARRPDRNPERIEAVAKLKDAYLAPLRRGENVFGLALHIDAGTVDVHGPTTVQARDLNLVRDRTRNYYPPRRLPGNR